MRRAKTEYAMACSTGGRRGDCGTLTRGRYARLFDRPEANHGGVRRQPARPPATKPNCGGWPDALRGSMDAAEYKHVVLGLIFLKYISDAFEETHAQLETEVGEGADPEDQDEYRAKGVFWVPAGGTLAAPAEAGPPVHHRAAGGRRHDRH